MSLFATAKFLILLISELKEFNEVITAECLSDPKRREAIRRALISLRLAPAVCAAANARTNLTQYIGVKDDGRVQGVHIRREQVGING